MPQFGAGAGFTPGGSSQRMCGRAGSTFEGLGVGGHRGSFLHCQQSGVDWERQVLCSSSQRDPGCSQAGGGRGEVGSEDFERTATLGQSSTSTVERRRKRKQGRREEGKAEGWKAEGRCEGRNQGGGERLLEERWTPERGRSEGLRGEVEPPAMFECGRFDDGLPLGCLAGGAVSPQVQMDPLRDGSLGEAKQQEVSLSKDEVPMMTPFVSPNCKSLREFGGSLMSHVHLVKHCKSWSMVADAFSQSSSSLPGTETDMGQVTLPPPEWVALTDWALHDLADEPDGENTERSMGLVRAQLERFGIWDELVTPVCFSEFFASKKVDYQGEEIKVAQYVIWEAVCNSLPLEVGKLELLDFCRLGTHYYVSHFDEFVVEPSAQRQVKPPKVMVEESQWPEVCRGLLDRGVCEVWPVDELHHIEGEPLLNGLFAVGKGEYVGPLEAQRLIMNLIPTNSIALSIQGDLPTLPMVSGLGGVLLDEGETRVLPMGFSNSVAIAQHVHRGMVASSGEGGLGALPVSGELRRDKAVSSSKCLHRVYLDNFDQLEIVDPGTAGLIKGTVSDQILALRHTYEQWGVPRHPKKAVQRQVRAEVQGALVIRENLFIQVFS